VTLRLQRLDQQPFAAFDGDTDDLAASAQLSLQLAEPCEVMGELGARSHAPEAMSSQIPLREGDSGDTRS
jgi:hypothetical protein